MKKYILTIVITFIVLISGVIGYRWFNRPLVSVVMLTYKRADIVSYAIESILAQNFDDYEFIILNDGSPDNTRDVVAKYKDKRIRYYENDKNRGISYSRNRAASLARGKYVMIMDDDDESLPDRMKKQVEFLETHPKIDILAGQIQGLPRIPSNHDNIATGLIQYNNFGNANTMYRRHSIVHKNIHYDENLKVSEDWDFWLQALFSGLVFEALPDDILVRHGDKQKHYNVPYEDGNQQIRKKVALFFAPNIPSSFFKANACDKLRLIAYAPVQIFSDDYLKMLLRENCPKTN